MTRPQRVIKPTLKVIENKEAEQIKATKQPKQSKQPVKTPKQKKVEQQNKLKDRIEQQKVINEEILQKEIDEDDVVVVRSDKDKIYNGLQYVDDDINRQTKKLIDGFKKDFLPPLWKGLVPLYVPKKDTPIKTKVLLSQLQEGKYHSSRSKSDPNVAKNIKTVLNNFKHFQDYKEDDLTYLITNHRLYLLDLLQYSYDRNLSIPTIKNFLNSLMRIMYIAFTKPRKQPLYIKYSTLAYSLGQKQVSIDDDNTLNLNEMGRFLRWEVILKKQKDLEQQFNNIKNKNTKEAFNLNMDLILLSIYVKTPVLRREVFHLEFKPKSEGHKKENDYVYFKKDKVILDLNKDKKLHSPIEIECNDDLANILKKSYELYPRQYLFNDIRKYPKFIKVGEDAVANRLKRIFVSYGVDIGPSILRSSFITYLFEKNPNMSMTTIKKYAILMRTSPQYILTSYRKILAEPAIIVSQEEDNDIKVEFTNLKQEVIDEDNLNLMKDEVDRTHRQKVKDTNSYEKHLKYMKDKYNNDEEYKQKYLQRAKEYKKKVGQEHLQRIKIVSQLRKDPLYRTKIKQSTLQKYNINLDEI